MPQWRKPENWRDENVAILDDGGNLRPLAGWTGPIRPLRLRRRGTALFGVSTRTFRLYQGRPVAFGRHPTLARVAAWGGGLP
ncbi:MAG: hypothetical protein Udaeo2_21540 [Candidatus Udaeobacter sp.]|nr:MAG: hypothetical protein Udaeo2_21540 [Candidatus Udaeobacter sp.]